MSDLDDIEKQYSPSKWSKRFSNCTEVIENHIKLTTTESEINKTKYNCKLNIAYGETDSEKYDIYYKNKEFGLKFSIYDIYSFLISKRFLGTPIFVYIHGGYWQELNKNISSYCVGPLVEKGYRVIIVGYNLCPKIKLNEIVKQIEKAILKIFQYSKETMSNQISFCGHSAGAHLIATVLLNQSINNKLQISKFLKSIFLISGVYDLTTLWKTDAVNCNNILDLDAKSAKALSPLYMDLNLLKNIYEKLKVYIIAGQNDSPVFQQQSENFHKILLKSSFKSELKIFLKYDHFDIVENLQTKDSEITKYIIENL